MPTRLRPQLRALNDAHRQRRRLDAYGHQLGALPPTETADDAIPTAPGLCQRRGVAMFLHRAVRVDRDAADQRRVRHRVSSVSPVPGMRRDSPDLVADSCRPSLRGAALHSLRGTVAMWFWIVVLLIVIIVLINSLWNDRNQ
jgi:hypothetical protein